jgi:hypothetical protein
VVYLEYWPAGFRRAGCSGEAVVTFFADHGFSLFDANTLARLDLPALRALETTHTGLRHTDLVAARRAPAAGGGRRGNDA